MQLPTLKKQHFAAPVGGVNSIAPASEIPETDAVYIYNLVRSNLGLRSRTGYQEWVTGLTGGADPTVRTILPYSGAALNGANDKLFAVTSTGIWDVTSTGGTAWLPNTVYIAGQRVTNINSGGVLTIYVCSIGGTSAASGGPTGFKLGQPIGDNTVTWLLVAIAPGAAAVFPAPTGSAGYGVSHAFSNSGGHYLIYCDEANGTYYYSEASGTWVAQVGGVAALWITSQAISIGTQVQVNGNIYIATAAGVTGGLASSAPSGVGNGQVDNTVTWNYVSAIVPNVIGPSIADQNNGLTITPGNFAAVTVWKSRIWFVEVGGTRGWYLGVNALYGTVTSFDFGVKMRVGGPLVGLYNWSYDGGSGLDTLLVGISGAGDIVIYQGTDPNSLQTFSFVGAWSVGAVPYGRRIAVEFGGDVLVVSLLGLVPLSKLCTGQPIDDKSIYDTQKISNVFNQYATLYQTLPGWAIIIHPTDNAILVNIPQPPGAAALQFVMAFSTKSWSVYRKLPIVSAAAWTGSLYIGTADGRVCVCQGSVDNVTLVNPANFQKPIAWSLLTGFRGAEIPTKKIVRQLRPSILSAVPNPIVQAVAKLDFDTKEPADTSGSGAGGLGTWDNAIWDTATWGGDFNVASPTIGAFGVAQFAVAVALRGQAISPTTVVGVDVFYEDASPV